MKQLSPEGEKLYQQLEAIDYAISVEARNIRFLESVGINGPKADDSKQRLILRKKRHQQITIQIVSLILE